MITSRTLIWIGHVAYMGGMRNAYKVFQGRYEGKRPKVKPRNRWEDSYEMDLKERGQENVGWIHLAHDRNPWCEHGKQSLASINYWGFLE